MNHTNGTIAERSRQRLVQALLTVMQQYDYKEITVTQLAQEAGLSRKTFYRLFADKDAILALLFEGLFQNFFEQVRAQNITHYWDLVQLLFDFWQERKDLLLLFQKSGLLPRVLEQSYQYSLELFVWVRSRETAASLAQPLPYLLAYSVGGMHSMLLKWVENGMEVPASELIAALRRGFRSDEL